jgi:phage tail-like protein
MLVEQQLHTMLTSAFRFVVAIDGAPLGAFTECNLPTIEWEIEEVKEGGVNTRIHQLPGQRRRTTITLKNGVGIASDLLAWYIAAINEQFWRRRVTITLLNSLLVPVIVMHIEDAFPIKWAGPQLRTDDNTIAIQTLELACGEITLV